MALYRFEKHSVIPNFFHSFAVALQKYHVHVHNTGVCRLFFNKVNELDPYLDNDGIYQIQSLYECGEARYTCLIRVDGRIFVEET